MSFQQPAVQGPPDVESLKSQAYEEIAHVSPSLVEVLRVKHAPHPKSLDRPTDVLEVLEKCKTVEGAIIVCSRLYVDAAVSVMDTMPYWEQAGRPTKEQATNPMLNSQYGAGPTEYYSSIHRLGLLNRAMNEIRAGITESTVLHFEALIRLNDAVLWKDLLAMYQKFPKTAVFLRKRLRMEIDTYDSVNVVSRNVPTSHTRICQTAIQDQERKTGILKDPSGEINLVLNGEVGQINKLEEDIREHKLRKVANRNFYERDGRDVWETMLKRFEVALIEARRAYVEAKAASDELQTSNGGFSSKQKVRRLS